MTVARRGTAIALALGIALAVAAVAPSTVSAAGTERYQSVPVVDWIAPGTAPLDGIGQWVYVAPPPSPGPGQIPTTGYVYGPSFIPIDTANGGGDEGTVGLSTDAQGPIAGIDLNWTGQLVTIRYDWSPGKFYYLFVHHLGDARWGGWVFDHAASAWTFIGSVQANPSGQQLRPWTGTAVLGAEGANIPAFQRFPLPPLTGTCESFPRVDAYFYPMVVYRGTDYAVSILDMSRPSMGECATETTFEQGWAHFRLGSLAGQ